jgi:hypothetical protein
MIDGVENKAKLWNMCMERKLFEQIPQSLIDNVQKKFEESVSIFSSQSVSTNDINYINEEIIKHFTNELLTLTSVNKESIQNDRKSDFEKRLQEKQDEFNGMMNKPKPEGIEFSQDKDEPLKGDLDDLIKKHNDERQNELNKVFQSQSPNSNLNDSNNTIVRPSVIEESSHARNVPLQNLDDQIQKKISNLINQTNKLQALVENQSTVINNLAQIQIQMLNILKTRM